MDRKTYWNSVRDYETEVNSLWHLPDQSVISSRIAPFAKGTVAADLGCGPGFWLHDLSAADRVYAVDFSEAMLSQAQRRAPEKTTFLRQDLSDLTLPEAVDLALCLNALMPESHADALLKLYRIFRCLKPGGRLILVLPAIEAMLHATNLSHFVAALHGKEADSLQANMDVWLDWFSNPLGYVRNPNETFVKYWARDEMEAAVALVSSARVTDRFRVRYRALPFGSPPPDHVAPPWHWGWVFERPCEPTTDWVAMGFAARQALSFDTGHAITVSAPSDTRPELSRNLSWARPESALYPLLESCATADTESEALARAYLELHERDVLLREGGPSASAPCRVPFDGHSAPLLATGDACACVRMMDPADGSRTWVPRDWVYLTGQQTGTREPSSVGTAAGDSRNDAILRAKREAYERHVFVSGYYAQRPGVELVPSAPEPFRFALLRGSDACPVVLALYQPAEPEAMPGLGLGADPDLSAALRKARFEAVQNSRFRRHVLDEAHSVSDRIETPQSRVAYWARRGLATGVGFAFGSERRAMRQAIAENIAGDPDLMRFDWFVRRIGKIPMFDMSFVVYRALSVQLVPMCQNETLQRDALQAYNTLCLVDAPHPFV